ncbi:MAG: thioredoxin-like domain-containing protein [Leeuwenhoekiella sp.]
MIKLTHTYGIRLLYLVPALLLVSCINGDSSSNEMYLGGQIINPTFKNASFLAGDRQIAKTPLDTANRFHFALGEIPAGLYHFRSGEEQSLYLEPGDSLLLRVNTNKFDESISFSGKGAKRNDFLMQLFLLTEEVNEHLVQQRAYSSAPREFRDMLISSKVSNQSKWKRFREKNKVSDAFAEIVQIILDYENYARLEVYPLTGLRGVPAQVLEQLPEDFYAYREEVNFNIEQAISLYSYQRFLNNYFNHKAFTAASKDGREYDASSFSHNLMKMREINSNIKNDSVKNFMLQRVVRDYLMNSNDKKGGEMLYEFYNEHANSTFYKNQIERLYHNNANIEAGKRLPKIKVEGYLSKDTLLPELINRPSVLFFWKTARQQHTHSIHQRIEKIKKHFPEFDYIGICLDREPKNWKHYLKKHPDFAKTAYHIDERLGDVRERLSLNSILKTFIVDKNGIIVNGHANAFSSDFEEELLALLNR